MEKQKQIEEMARICREHRNPTACIYPESEDCRTDCELYSPDISCRWIKTAKALFNAGYRKIPENSVVLTEKEYKRYERIEKTIKLSKMYKALGYEVKNGKLYYYSNLLEGCEIEFKDLQEICEMANHYLEEFCGLDQRLTFWQAKAEETRKEMAEKFAERLKEMHDYDERLCDIADEICKEITEE